MKEEYFKTSYNIQTKELMEKYDLPTAMSLAVGGHFHDIGQLEYALLLQEGLEKKHNIIDIGCGSGRLAFQLKDYLEGQYVGIDVVEDLFKFAERICKRSDWRFYEAPGLVIPEADNYADFICFFSVFTHLLHEESYRYLQEAARVIKPKGKIIFSFLDFKIPSHWLIFEQTVANQRQDKVLNQFMSQDAIKAWAKNLGLDILNIYDGDKPHIQIDRLVQWNNGTKMTIIGNNGLSVYAHLGQSVCVLTKQ